MSLLDHSWGTHIMSKCKTTVQNSKTQLKSQLSPTYSNMAYPLHYIDVIMTTIASQITSLTVVYSTVYSDADQRRHQSSASLAFVWGIHRDRWIPRTKGQLRRNCFHLMTSSWEVVRFRLVYPCCMSKRIAWIVVIMSILDKEYGSRYVGCVVSSPHY